MKSVVRIMCWKCSHVNELSMNRLQEEKLLKDIPKMKKVCPDCKPSNEAIVVVNGHTIFNPAKAYRCSKGHLSLISLLSQMINICFGPNDEDFVNIKATLDELPNLVDSGDISCNHVVDGKTCDCKLTAVDSFDLSYPSSPSVKTRTRIGDLWDRAGVEPVRSGSYDGDTGNYNESRTQKLNDVRLKRMRRQRNIPVDKSPGKRVNRATKKDYGYRDKSSLEFDQ